MGQDKEGLRCTEHIRLAESFVDIIIPVDYYVVNLSPSP